MEKELTKWYEEFYARVFEAVPKVCTWADDWALHGNEWQSHHDIHGNGDGKAHIRKKTPYVVKDWKSGETCNVVKLYGDINGCGWFEAVARICKTINFAFFDDDMMAKMKASAEAEAKKEKAIDIAMAALLAPSKSNEAKKIEGYLIAHRGYKRTINGRTCLDAALVKNMKIGALTPEAKAAFEEAGIPCKSAFGFNWVVVPTYNNGHLSSVTLRNADAQCANGDRYRFIYPTAEDAKGGIHAIDTSTASDLVLVEGEFDALHIKAMNALQWDEDATINVAALGTHNISKKAASEIRAMATKKDANGKQILKSITLLYDAGEDEKGEAKAASIKAIEDATMGMVRVYVASIPLPHGENKCDADTFLNGHPLTDLKKIVDEADTATMWKAEKLCQHYEAIRNANGGDLTAKDMDAMEDDFADILAGATNPNDRNKITLMWEGTGRDGEALRMKAESIRKKAATASERKAAEEFIKEAAQRISTAKDLDAEMSAIIGEMKALKADAMQSEIDELLRIPTAEELNADWQRMRAGIPMPYIFKLGKQPDQCQQFTIPSGALTYVAAPTSNGKSCMLQNMALYTAAQCSKDESILYFVFEESGRDTRTELLANYCGIHFSRSNKNTIKKYLSKGVTKFFADKAKGPKQLSMLKDEFIKRYLTNGRIIICDKDVDASHLIAMMTKAASQRNIKAIFIDYMQKMHDTNLSNANKSRDYELGGICDALNTFCNESGLPVVLAAQISRTGSKSPMEISCNTIADASSIEKAAHAIILLYQNKGHYTGASKEWSEKEFLHRLQAKGIADEIGIDDGNPLKDVFPEDGRNRIWMRIDKYRGEESGGEMIFDFDGPTGRVKPNIKKYINIPDADIDAVPMDAVHVMPEDATPMDDTLPLTPKADAAQSGIMPF